VDSPTVGVNGDEKSGGYGRGAGYLESVDIACKVDEVLLIGGRGRAVKPIPKNQHVRI
jgi:hypothetical protein